MKIRCVLLLLSLIAALPVAHAQGTKWPDRSVRVIVPFATGGSTDIITRLITARLSKEFGQQFIVDNRGGAGGSLGAEIAIRANPDGYTMMVAASSYATNAALYKLPYDPVKDIAAVGMLHNGPFLLAVNSAVPATSVKELVDLARAKPGTISYGSSGPGGANHLATELFRQLTNINILHVPYKGDAPTIVGLIGGEVQFTLSSVPALLPHVKTGRVRALGVSTEKRSRELPDLPSISETIPGYEHTSWNGMWAPAGTPQEILTRLNQALGRILSQPDMQERLRKEGREPAHSSPEEFQRVIARDIAKWSKVVKAGNIKID